MWIPSSHAASDKMMIGGAPFAQYFPHPPLHPPLPLAFHYHGHYLHGHHALGSSVPLHGKAEKEPRSNGEPYAAICFSGLILVMSELVVEEEEEPEELKEKNLLERVIHGKIEEYTIKRVLQVCLPETAFAVVMCGPCVSAVDASYRRCVCVCVCSRVCMGRCARASATSPPTMWPSKSSTRSVGKSDHQRHHQMVVMSWLCVVLQDLIGKKERDRQLPETPLAEVFFAHLLQGHPHVMSIRWVGQ